MPRLFRNNPIVSMFLQLLMAAFLVGCACAVERFGLVDQYVQLVMMFICVNIIMSVSLTLVNGIMGEFSVGHAGFMAVGAYVSAILTMRIFPPEPNPALFVIAVLAGGMAASLLGMIVAFPSFKTRGDYLAIVTLAFNMIVKSILENIDNDWVNGPRGLAGIEKLTSLPIMACWVIVTIVVIRHYLHSSFGRGALAIREDEIAAEIMGVGTRRIKLMTFMLSAFFAGVGGALFAHTLGFISPRSFDILKSTDFLIMVYLGGAGSIPGAIMGAIAYTSLMEILRELPEKIIVWRMVVLPAILVLIMLFRPKGLMGIFQDGAAGVMRLTGLGKR